MFVYKYPVPLGIHLGNLVKVLLLLQEHSLDLAYLVC